MVKSSLSWFLSQVRLNFFYACFDVLEDDGVDGVLRNLPSALWVECRRGVMYVGSPFDVFAWIGV